LILLVTVLSLTCERKKPPRDYPERLAEPPALPKEKMLISYFFAVKPMVSGVEAVSHVTPVLAIYTSD
jgi:hypothetical protein